ncbi:hypothetical protein [Chryseobacterium daeguense]|uniref:hypothetical protein n=1 Tax=Chryseobacterium daeguense TaxID=412438 RepID=UPI00040B48E4|nr:hypothetical protein [Chryseobacterium daeguense]
MSVSDKIKKTKSLRATNIELQSRDISVTKDDKKIYLRDFDNDYPLRIENIINNSPTGKRSSNMMAKFIFGKGVAENKDLIVNRKGQTLNNVARIAASCISKQYGAFFYTSWTVDLDADLNELKPILKPTDLKVLDYVPMAKSKSDDDGFPGKFYQLKQDSKGKFQRVDEKTKWFYPYNNDPKVIIQQMKKDCELKGIKEPTTQDLLTNYRGQVFYLNLTPEYHYALPPWDVAYDDMDTEYRISRYNNTQARKGWLGKTVVKMFGGDEEEDQENDAVLKENLGSENSADVLTIRVPAGVSDDINKVFAVDQLKAQFDDKLFESTKKTLKQNISGNFNNIPESMVYASETALFAPNSDTFTEMKKFYWEQNEDERTELESVLSMLSGLTVSFIPVVDEENIDEDEKLRKQSQAALKGSVGGVTALLEIQKSVAAKTTDINSAIEIIKEIFGIPEETARKMLGTPEKTEGNEL